MKMVILPKATCRFNATHIKISMSFFSGIEMLILIFIWKHKKTLMSKSNPEQKNKAGSIKIPDFKLYCRNIVTKTVWYWQKNRHKDQ
jgi:hypothetical protein